MTEQRDLKAPHFDDPADRRCWLAVRFEPQDLTGLYLLAAIADEAGQVVDPDAPRNVSGSVARQQDGTAHGGDANHLFLLDGSATALEARMVLALAPDAPGWSDRMADLTAEITLTPISGSGIAQLSIPLDKVLSRSHLAGMVARAMITEASARLEDVTANGYRAEDYVSLCEMVTPSKV
ncbi:MAG: hypothetical protein Alpg2KO_07660 [Alphaproteobacteria bacterium]